MGDLRSRTMASMVTSNSFRNSSIAHIYANVPVNSLKIGMASIRLVNAVNAVNALKVGKASIYLRLSYHVYIRTGDSYFPGKTPMGQPNKVYKINHPQPFGKGRTRSSSETSTS
ncbi:2689_t:CDS:2, partial [Paraglomus occultum]